MVTERPVHSWTMPSVNIPVTGAQPVAAEGVNIIVPIVTTGSAVPTWRKLAPVICTVWSPWASQIGLGVIIATMGGGAMCRTTVSSDLQSAGGGLVTRMG